MIPALCLYLWCDINCHYLRAKAAADACDSPPCKSCRSVTPPLSEPSRGRPPSPVGKYELGCVFSETNWTAVSACVSHVERLCVDLFCGEARLMQACSNTCRSRLEEFCWTGWKPAASLAGYLKWIKETPGNVSLSVINRLRLHRNCVIKRIHNLCLSQKMLSLQDLNNSPPQPSMYQSHLTS